MDFHRWPGRIYCVDEKISFHPGSYLFNKLIYFPSFYSCCMHLRLRVFR